MWTRIPMACVYFKYLTTFILYWPPFIWICALPPSCMGNPALFSPQTLRVLSRTCRHGDCVCPGAPVCWVVFGASPEGEDFLVSKVTLIIIGQWNISLSLWVIGVKWKCPKNSNCAVLGCSALPRSSPLRRKQELDSVVSPVTHSGLGRSCLGIARVWAGEQTLISCAHEFRREQCYCFPLKTWIQTWWLCSKFGGDGCS